MNALKHQKFYPQLRAFTWEARVNYFVPVLALCLAAGTACKAEESLQNRAIKIGMSTALNGPARELGREVRAGVLAAFHELNSSGALLDEIWS